MKLIIHALICLAIPVLLVAQENAEPVTTFQELMNRMRPGATIRIHRPSTARYGERPGLEEVRLAEISLDGSNLVLTDEKGVPHLLDADVDRVDLAVPYTTTFALGGTLIGAAAGFGAMAGLVAAACEQPDCGGTDYAFAYGAALGAPLGAVIGFAAGRSIKRESMRWKTLYQSARRPQAGFFPIFDRHRKGAAFWISF
jgi:hypothetical protein